MSGEDDATKSHEPSRRKLENARRKGEVPRSQDISTAASYAGMVLAAAAVGAESLGMAASQMRTLIGQADRHLTPRSVRLCRERFSPCRPSSSFLRCWPWPC